MADVPNPFVRLVADALKHLALEEWSDRPLNQIMFWSDGLGGVRPQDRTSLAQYYATPADQCLVVAALRAGRVLDSYLGWADCRICGARLGTRDLTGYGLVWPEKCEHYVEAHGVWTEGLDRLLDAIKSGGPTLGL